MRKFLQEQYYIYILFIEVYMYLVSIVLKPKKNIQ